MASRPPQTIISLPVQTAPVTASANGRVDGARCSPTVSAGVVPSAGVETAAVISAPDDHFGAGPDCRVIPPSFGRVGDAGGSPTVSAGVVSSAGVEKGAGASLSAPDDHFSARPDCR